MQNITIVDLSQDHIPKSRYISNTLISSIQKSLDSGKKSLIYLNKRGSFNFKICRDCNYIFKCPRCDISMSVHKNINKLVCHHCSYMVDEPLVCVECSGVKLENIGVGTEQIEETLRDIFKYESIFRMDGDSIKNKTIQEGAIQKIKDSNIIIGTKMITTGYDFSDIKTIGVILIEQELSIPSYTTEESIYQNFKQLIGRGGRLGGEVDIIVQSYASQNDTIKNIIYSNYNEFFNYTLKERREFSYPPFGEYATLLYKNKSRLDSIKYIDELYDKLTKLNDQKLDIIKTNIPYKRNNQYFCKIIIKGENIKKLLLNIKKQLFLEKDLVVIFD